MPFSGWNQRVETLVASGDFDQNMKGRKRDGGVLGSEHVEERLDRVHRVEAEQGAFDACSEI